MSGREKKSSNTFLGTAMPHEHGLEVGLGEGSMSDGIGVGADFFDNTFLETYSRFCRQSGRNRGGLEHCLPGIICRFRCSIKIPGLGHQQPGSFGPEKTRVEVIDPHSVQSIRILDAHQLKRHGGYVSITRFMRPAAEKDALK